jgi:hypothetical protein
MQITTIRLKKRSEGKNEEVLKARSDRGHGEAVISPGLGKRGVHIG